MVITYGVSSLWMRTPNTRRSRTWLQIGKNPYVIVNPGEADPIMLNIKNSNFDFKAFKVEIERYNIDATDGNSNEQIYSQLIQSNV